MGPSRRMKEHSELYMYTRTIYILHDLYMHVWALPGV